MRACLCVPLFEGGWAQLNPINIWTGVRSIGFKREFLEWETVSGIGSYLIAEEK